MPMKLFSIPIHALLPRASQVKYVGDLIFGSDEPDIPIAYVAALVLAIVVFLCFAMRSLHAGEVRRIAVRQRLEERRRTKRLEEHPKSA